MVRPYCCDFGHRTWKNLPGIKLEGFVLLAHFHAARDAMDAAKGEVIGSHTLANFHGDRGVMDAAKGEKLLAVIHSCEPCALQ